MKFKWTKNQKVHIKRKKKKKAERKQWTNSNFLGCLLITARTSSNVFLLYSDTCLLVLLLLFFWAALLFVVLFRFWLLLRALLYFNDAGRRTQTQGGCGGRALSPRQRVETRAGGFVPLIYPLTETFKDATRRFGGLPHFSSTLSPFVSQFVTHAKQTKSQSLFSFPNY